MSGHVVSVKIYLAIFGALLILTGVTTGIAFIDLGRLNTIVALLIAGLKMMLVVLYFMHLRYSSRLTWVFAGAGIFFLAILIGFLIGDEVSRKWQGTSQDWSRTVPLPPSEDPHNYQPKPDQQSPH